jgi:glycosyltransferase involved in cell wall biosynthesis
MVPQRRGRGQTPPVHSLVVPTSVVIPCHNSLRFLPETVASVLAQTDADLEVVLVDDGGTDDLAGWVGAQRDDRVRLVRQDNAGPSAARNRGIAESTGGLVAFLDSDDVWEPSFLAELVPLFEDRSVGMAYAGWDVVDENGTPNGRVSVPTWEGDVWDRFVTRNPVAC